MGNVTIKMIAKQAGVSRGTVGRILNNRPYVNEEVKQVVMQIAQELHYRPNMAAKALKNSQKKQVIRVIVPSVKSPFCQVVCKGVTAAQQEYTNVDVTVELVQMEGISYDEELMCIAQAEQDFHWLRRS